MKAILSRTLVAAAALFSSGTSAFADCTLNDLEGTWTAYFHGSSYDAVTPIYFSCKTFDDYKGVMYCMGPGGSSQPYLSKFTLVDGASCSYSFVAELYGDFKFNATLNQNTNILVGVNTEKSVRGSPYYLAIIVRAE